MIVCCASMPYLLTYARRMPSTDSQALIRDYCHMLQRFEIFGLPPNRSDKRCADFEAPFVADRAAGETNHVLTLTYKTTELTLTCAASTWVCTAHSPSESLLATCFVSFCPAQFG
mmetsp:Transcript_80333/g.215325  ORF Transcript_80333/g.215325 Transcript_80333/m.215325 type:complete len:115 (+) Transcript_80333:1572-1916(+)